MSRPVTRRRLLGTGAAGLLLGALSPVGGRSQGAAAQAAPQAAVQRDEQVYAGPGDAEFDVIATLAAGAAVAVTGLYGDFTQVSFDAGAGPQTGYLPSAALTLVPDGVPQLSADEVPWVPLIDAGDFYDARIVRTGDGLRYDNAGSATWFGTQAGPAVVSDRVRLTALLAGSAGLVASVGILSRQPTAERPWQGINSLYLSRTQVGLQLEIWDGRANGPSARISLPDVPADQLVWLTLGDTAGTSLVLQTADGAVRKQYDLTAINGLQLPAGLFPDRTAYLGLLVAPGASLSVDNLALSRVPSGVFTSAPAAHTPLRALAAQRGLRIGTTIAIGGSQYPAYRKQLRVITAREFNTGAAWVNWGGIERTRGERNYRYFDSLFTESELTDHATFVYNLVNPDPRQLPQWMQGITSAAEMADALASFVFETVSRARGRAYAWNVVCESQHPRGDILQSRMGPEYLDIAFAAARAADPSAKLVYADFNNHTRTSGRYQLTLDIVRRLSSQGLIDMVGLECAAIPADRAPSYDELLDCFRSYRLPVIITELAVVLHFLQGTPEARLARQADIYGTFMSAVLDSGVCHDVLFEAIVDKLSIWETAGDVLPGVFPDNSPTLYDDDLKPKPAYYAVSAVLQKAAPSATDV
jgi:endo-1,4-beta-xylanase